MLHSFLGGDSYRLSSILIAKIKSLAERQKVDRNRISLSIAVGGNFCTDSLYVLYIKGEMLQSAVVNHLGLSPPIGPMQHEKGSFDLPMQKRRKTKRRPLVTYSSSPSGSDEDYMQYAHEPPTPFHGRPHKVYLIVMFSYCFYALLHNLRVQGTLMKSIIVAFEWSKIVVLSFIGDGEWK